MEIKLDSVMFRKFTHDMLEVGRIDMATQLGVISDNLTQRQAKLMYKSKLDIWEKRGLIKGNKQRGGNSPIYYSRIELEILDRSEKYDL